MSTEEPTNNEAAPNEGQGGTTGKETTVDQTGKSGQTTTTTDKTGSTTGQSGIDVQEVTRKYESLEKSYKELQRFSTQTSQERAEIKKELGLLKEYIEKATEKPFDIEQFKREWDAHGPKALDNYFKPQMTKMQEEYQKQLSEERMARTQLTAQVELYARRGDETNYPDFENLEAKMTEIANDPNCPVDLRKPIGQVLDALYKLAREQNSSAAVQAAEELGRKKGERNLAKESKTTVAGGGKTQGGIPADLQKMDFKKLEQVVTDMVGIADRD